MIPAERRAALEFSRPGSFLVPVSNTLSQGARAQMLGLWRVGWDVGLVALSITVQPLLMVDAALATNTIASLEVWG